MKPFSLSKYPRMSSKQTTLIEKILDRNLLKNGDTYDKTFVWLLLCLLCFGLVMVYSASGAQAGLYRFDNRSAFLIKQLEYALFGLSMAYVLMRVPMWRWQRWTKYLLIGILLVLVVLPFVGEEVNSGAAVAEYAVGCESAAQRNVQADYHYLYGGFFQAQSGRVARL